MEPHVSAQWKSLLLDFTSHEIAVSNALPHRGLMCQPSGKGFTRWGGSELYHPLCHTDLIKGKYSVKMLPTAPSAHSKREKKKKKISIFKLCCLPILTQKIICSPGTTFQPYTPITTAPKDSFLTQYVRRCPASKFSLLFPLWQTDSILFLPYIKLHEMCSSWNVITVMVFRLPRTSELCKRELWGILPIQSITPWCATWQQESQQPSI